MRTSLVILLAGLAFVGTAEAGLGETKKQITARYGKPLDDVVIENSDGQPLNCLKYVKSNETCYFFVLLNDRVEIMQMYNQDRPPFREEDFIKILNQNAAGKGFKKIESSDLDPAREKKYSEIDTGRIAYWQITEGVLTIKTSETRVAPKLRSGQIEEINKKTEEHLKKNN